MKDTYRQIEIEVIFFESADIITGSDPDDLPPLGV